MSALDELLLKKYRESVVDPLAQVEKVPTEKVPADDVLIADESASEIDPLDAEAVSVREEIATAPDAEVSSAEEAILDAQDQVESSDQQEEISASQEPVADSSRAEQSFVDQASTSNEDLETDGASSESKPEVVAVVQFKADWEVDRFLWPGICSEVEDRVEQELTEAIGSIEEQCKQRGMNIVAITGSRPGAGATTMTLCLAREAARQGLRVALIDLNHSNPTVMDRLGIAFEEGTESLQKADITPEGICVVAIEDGVSFFPTVEAIDLEYCVGDDVTQLVAVVSRHHDLVLIDASNEVAKLISERQAFGQHGTIVVTEPSTVRDVVPVTDQDDHTLGVIENFAA